jgi:cell division protein FtsI (penicillin-binding protein 3)
MSPATLRAHQIKFTSSRHTALEQTRQRMTQLLYFFGFLAAILILRLFDLTVLQSNHGRVRSAVVNHPYRADIVDRNNTVLATSLRVRSVGVRSELILNKKAAIAQLKIILPDVNPRKIDRAFAGRGDEFVWIKRAMTPRQAAEVLKIGEPGLQFRDEFTRVYPNGGLAAHAIGGTDTDGMGISGLEKFMDARMRGPAASQPVMLSLDTRVQFALEDELAKAVEKSGAIGGFGIVMDVNSGEVQAMAAVPTFNPNDPGTAAGVTRYNSVTKGLYELGSTFKAFAIAQGLDQGTTTPGEIHNTSRPLHIAGFTIKDFHAKNRPLTTTETFIYSSNIGTALIEDEYGPVAQRAFLDKLGLLSAPGLEVAEVAKPLIPKVWGRLAGMTVAYGHGMAVTPLHLAQGMSAMINGGYAIHPTLLSHKGLPAKARTRVISETTSDHMRALLRLTVTQGTGNYANVPGYRVGGKTGTAEKPKNGGYATSAKISTFAGVFPMDAPRYIVIASIDEPRTGGGTTGGIVAAPVVANLILRTAPVLGVARDPSKDVNVEAYIPFIAHPRAIKIKAVVR